MIASTCVPYVLRESHTLNTIQSRLHGLDHWWRVWKNGLMLTGQDESVDLEVVAMYALFHDSMRLNDHDDRAHGMRGYALWERWKGLTGPRNVESIFSPRQEELLFEACTEHSEGHRSTNPTIAICWDADRLDLPRKAIWPDARYMSTAEAIALCMNRLH